MSSDRPAGGAFRRARTVSATDAQNNFGELMRGVAGDEVFYIQSRGVDRAVVLSVGRYQELLGEDDELGELEREFDAMLAAMQTEASVAAADSLFAASPAELGEAAVRAAEAANRAAPGQARD